jgi:hypothetical protein
MPKRLLPKRFYEDQDDGEPPQPRRSVTTAGAGPSTAPSDLGKIREKSLSVENLVEEVAKMAKNRDRAELMILGLMEEYSFDFPRLKELLRGKLDTPESLVMILPSASNHLLSCI